MGYEGGDGLREGEEAMPPLSEQAYREQCALYLVSINGMFARCSGAFLFGPWEVETRGLGVQGQLQLCETSSPLPPKKHKDK